MGRPDVKHNCRYCRHAGPVRNFVCHCTALGIGRATGVRLCKLFEMDERKYNDFMNYKN